MAFSLDDALPYLRCPVSGSALERAGARLVTPHGHSYPIVDEVVDLTVQTAAHAAAHSDYDRIAGAAYNFWIFNPFAMAFTWGLGVLRMPVLLQPGRELSPGVFLEVPCGTGIFTARAYRENPRTNILALDFSMGMLRAAQRRSRKLGVRNAVFIRADVARLPMASDSLDGCLSLAGFHAFPDPAAAASEIGRVLKQGAKVAASVACSGERKLSDFMIERVMKPGGYFSSGLSSAAYRSYFERGGFRDMDVKMAGAVAVMRGVRSTTPAWTRDA